MALRNPSLFLYGLQVTQNNSSIDFRAVALETPRQATLRLGFYSLNSLSDEVKRALEEVDPARTYTVSVDRTVSGGTQNRVTISSSGLFFELLFLSGPRTASTSAPLLGFPIADQTGATSYQGNSTCGTRLIPNMVGYNYLSPDFDRKVFGSVNVSASGEKEAIVYNIQKFWQVQFKYIPEAIVSSEWVTFLEWMIQQRLIEFTPDITDPTSFYEGTLESTLVESKGLAYRMGEMLPQFPFLYDTGLLRFRQRVTSLTFI